MAPTDSKSIHSAKYNEVARNPEALESIYEASLHQLNLICENEQARKLRLQIYLLETDLRELHDQLAEDDDHIMNLNSAREEAQQEVSVLRQNLESANGEIRLKSREVETLKIELRSLHDVTMDSTKLLTEKLSLSREISALKPELDYLRSQAVSHQSTLTEKLNLQQQCTALQAELDSARRSAQRANAKEGRLQTEENKYKDQIDALNRELAAERKERQRIERESAQFAAESQAKNEVMVSRLDAFRTKLKSTKEQLKEAQENAKLAQITNNETHDFRRPEKPGPGPCGGLRKRKAGMIEPDTTVGTPGDAPAAKRGKRTSTLPGDKSMFSTTPFLNRTMSVAPESPNSDRAQSPIVSANEQAIPSARRVEIQRDPAPPATASGPGEQAPNMSTSNVKGRKSSLNPTRQTQAPSRKPLVSTTLELVAEESDGQAISRETVGNAKITIEAKKKKRKLLGNNMSKTLFDEDGGEAASLKRGIGGYSRPMKALGRNTLGSGIGVVKLGVMEPTTGVGGFSPLKKDRRAGTSFIG